MDGTMGSAKVLKRPMPVIGRKPACRAWVAKPMSSSGGTVAGSQDHTPMAGA